MNRAHLSISNFQMKPLENPLTSKQSTKLHQACSEKEILCLPELREPTALWEPPIKRMLPSRPSRTPGQPPLPRLQGPRLLSGEGRVRRPAPRALRPHWPLLVTPGLPPLTRSSLLRSVTRRQLQSPV